MSVVANPCRIANHPPAPPISPPVKTKTRPHSSVLGLRIISCVVLLFSLVSCVTNPVTGEKDFVLVSEKGEISIGRDMHPEIVKQYGGEYENEVLQSYVTRIGNALAKKSHRSHLNYHFTVLDDPTVNAFALPGGYTYVTRGILAYMQSEAELAGVIGHEIGHVTARHGVRAHSRSTVLGVLAQTAQKAMSDVSGAPYYGELISLVGRATVAGYGRAAELEADRLGAEYIYLDGYDPSAILGVLGALKHNAEFHQQKKSGKSGKKSQQWYHGVFATHPDTDKRLQKVVLAANQLPRRTSKPDNVDEFLQQIDGMTYGPSGEEKPKHIKIITVSEGETIADLAKKSSLAEYQEDQLRLINGLYPDGEPTAGQKFKMVQ